MVQESYYAIVDSLDPKGKHGPYAIAKSESLGPISFSLKPSVWSENKWPELGTYVVLSGLTRKRAGWRAEQGRFLRPSDEKKEK